MTRQGARAGFGTSGGQGSQPAQIMDAVIVLASMTTALLLALAGSLILMTLIVQRLNKASN